MPTSRMKSGNLQNTLKQEWLPAAAVTGVVLTSLFMRRIPTYTREDISVVFVLWVFRVIVRGLEATGLIGALARRFNQGRHVCIRMLVLTAALSMLITNDVALLTVVPITLSMKVKDRATLVILETLTANGASALTPFGNPQNLFIFYHYHLDFLTFMLAILPFFAVSVIAVLFMGKITGRKETEALSEHSGTSGQSEPLQGFQGSDELSGKAYLYILFFLLFILAVGGAVPLIVGIIPPAFAVLWDRKALRVDYPLLLTFLALFGLSNNLSHLFALSLSDSGDVFLYSALASQAISNVPAALLFAGFTDNWRALLWGVSVGGFGNIIGSMASVISYRLYQARFRDSWRYLKRFHLLSYLMFFIGCAAYLVVMVV